MRGAGMAPVGMMDQMDQMDMVDLMDTMDAMDKMDRAAAPASVLPLALAAPTAEPTLRPAAHP